MGCVHDWSGGECSHYPHLEEDGRKILTHLMTCNTREGVTVCVQYGVASPPLKGFCTLVSACSCLARGSSPSVSHKRFPPHYTTEATGGFVPFQRTLRLATKRDAPDVFFLGLSVLFLFFVFHMCIHLKAFLLVDECGSTL